MIDSFVSRVSSTKGHYLAKKFKELSSLPCLDYQFFQTIHKSKMNFLVVYFNLLKFREIFASMLSMRMTLKLNKDVKQEPM